MKHSLTKKIVFLDRDGVINKKAEDHHYITNEADFVFNEGIFEVCTQLKQEGYEFIVITNQRGVARNMLTEETLRKIHVRMLQGFSERGISILDVFYCPHNTNECKCRKPSPGMLEEAFEKYSIDMERSVLISDSQEDVNMGKLFGLGRNILVTSDKPEEALSHFKKIKIAFIKYGGLTSGGSEKLLQIIAANLPKERFDITYFYCDPAQDKGGVFHSHKSDLFRLAYMKDAAVRLVKFSVGEKDLTVPTHTWRDTNFFSVFNERDFDIVQTCRSGHKEYPFTHIRKKPIVDIIALSSGSDNQYNISRVLHLCKESRDGWVKRGGDKGRVRYVSLPISTKDDNGASFTKELGLENCFVFGMHQRPDNNIFSPIPLLAYSKVQNQNTKFLILGGGSKYKEQADELGLSSVVFLDATGDSETIFSFLRTLSVYAHGRMDGEINSQAIAEAMYIGLPVVSHVSVVNNGHVEGIGDAGVVVDSVSSYQEEMQKLIDDKEYFNFRRENSFKRFSDHYELSGQIKKYAEVYEEVMIDPFPNKIRRFLVSLHYTQNIRLFAVYAYLKYVYLKKLLFKTT